jgi:hypothetical protein
MSIINSGDHVRIDHYTCSHDRLTLIVRGENGDEARIELIMCTSVRFTPFWRASKISITSDHQEGLLRISGDKFEVICEEIQRWKSTNELETRITARDIPNIDAP